MLHQAYAVLLLVAVLVNWRDWRMLALTLMVGVSVFIPVPRDSGAVFYSFCAAFEAVVLFSALLLRARASEVIASLCIVLILAHIMGYCMNSWNALSSYRLIVPLLESAQIVACVFWSPVLFHRIRNRES
jgi:hypothetical protein